MPRRKLTCRCGKTFEPRYADQAQCSAGCRDAAGPDERVAPSPAAIPPEERDLETLRTAYHQSLRDLDQARKKQAAVVRAVREAVFDAAQEIKLDPPKPRVFPKRIPGKPEIAIVHASDWQLGKVTPSYNSEVCEARVKRFAERVIRIAQIQSADHPVTEARVYLTGDMIEGEGIFPTQPHVVDGGLYRQLAVNGPRILTNFLLDLLEYFERIHVVGVIGNHGALRLASGAADPETNADRMLYQFVRQLFLGVDEKRPTEWAKSGRITFNVPDGPGESNFFAVDNVFDWGFLLAHGDQIRGGFAGFPFYGYAKKAWGWIDAIDEPWDYLLTGHWHTPTSLTLNKRQVRVNGSTESDNTYAQEQLAAVGHPTQFLGFCHPKHGLTSEYWVSLEDREPSLSRAKRWSAA